MSTVYEDNYGFYVTDNDPEELAFFIHVKLRSVSKKCARCKQTVQLQPEVILCATCSQALEYGAPSDQAWIVRHLPL
jgi:Zn finger protein HypA/HybF involved in hydrogenase expression